MKAGNPDPPISREKAKWRLEIQTHRYIEKMLNKTSQKGPNQNIHRFSGDLNNVVVLELNLFLLSTKDRSLIAKE